MDEEREGRKVDGRDRMVDSRQTDRQTETETRPTKEGEGVQERRGVPTRGNLPPHPGTHTTLVCARGREREGRGGRERRRV